MISGQSQVKYYDSVNHLCTFQKHIRQLTKSPIYVYIKRNCNTIKLTMEAPVSLALDEPGLRVLFGVYVYMYRC